MSWIAEYDTQGKEFPTCVHVTKTTGTMTHGATYVPIEDGRVARVENAKLRELVRDMLACINNVSAHDTYCWDYCDFCKMYITKGRCDFESRMRELGVEV